MLDRQASFSSSVFLCGHRASVRILLKKTGVPLRELRRLRFDSWLRHGINSNFPHGGIEPKVRERKEAKENNEKSLRLCELCDSAQ